MTPSGLSMGTTLNTKLSRRMRARGELPQINSTSLSKILTSQLYRPFA